MKWLVWLVVLVAAAVVATMAVWSSDLLKIDREALEEQYARPDSKFMDVDGVRVHYLDAGTGSAVVLLHASFMHLFTWDGLAKALEKDHRVIRLDFLTAGLTGPEPNGNYSFDRNLELVHQMTQNLGVDKFALVATSSGGIVGFNYAARYPERVTRLVLVNSAGLPRTARTDPNRPRGSAIGRWFITRHQTKGMLRDILDRNFIEPNEPPEWLVEMNHDFGRKKGLLEEGSIMRQNFSTGDPETVLGRIRAPTLVLWGLDNQTVVHLEADVFQHWLVNAPTLKKKYPGVGHYLYLEIPEEFESDVGDFLAGRLDGKLQYRRTSSFEIQEESAPTDQPDAEDPGA